MLNFDLRAFVITDTNYIFCTFTHNCYLLMVIHADVKLMEKRVIHETVK